MVKTILILRSDIAIEYFSFSITSFFDITWHSPLIVMSTKWHNWKENRHLVEIDCFFHSNVKKNNIRWHSPLIFLSITERDNFNYLVFDESNAFSSLKNKIPYSMLFIREPLTYIVPHVFGSSWFIHDLSPSLDIRSLLSHLLCFSLSSYLHLSCLTSSLLWYATISLATI